MLQLTDQVFDRRILSCPPHPYRQGGENVMLFSQPARVMKMFLGTATEFLH